MKLAIALSALIALAAAATSTATPKHEDTRKNTPVRPRPNKQNPLQHLAKKSSNKHHMGKLKPSTRPSRDSKYILIKGKYDWNEAAQLCWKNGYELAALDSGWARTLAMWLRRGIDGVFEHEAGAVWFGSLDGHKSRSGKKIAACVLHLKRSYRAKPSVHRLSRAAADHLRLRAPILCQLRHPRQVKDALRYDDRRPYCSQPKSICVLGKAGPECQDLCGLGQDKLWGAEPGIRYGMTKRYYKELRHSSSGSSSSRSYSSSSGSYSSSGSFSSSSSSR